MSPSRLRIAFDIGGTFTDFVIHDQDSGERHFAKVLSTHHDPAEAMTEGIARLLERSGAQASADIEVLHATTIATNAVIERKGAATALLTTRGFRDVLLLGRQKRYEMFDLHLDKPRPLVLRSDIFELDERVLHDGRIEQPLQPEALDRVVARLVDAGYAAVAVCLLHSYANPAHERQVGRRVAEAFAAHGRPVQVTLSCDISPKIREYERTSTTVADAYVKPMVRRYIDDLRSRLDQMGLRGELSIIQSNGGLITPHLATSKPISIVESGPAAGVLMCAAVGREEGCEHVLSFDMGGTTAKLGAIAHGEPAILSSFEVDQLRYKPGSGLPLNISAIELLEIGAGGGSIAAIELGLLKIGPESAGSAPGPICYGRGGNRPTVTDANLVLGYLDPGYFNDGAMRLDAAAAREGIEREIARPLGVSVEQAAWGIHALATSNMERATRIVSVERGRDPREHALVAFGGAGPLHAARLAMGVGAPTVIVPVGAGVGSAIGLLEAAPRLDYSASRIVPMTAASADALVQIAVQLRQRAQRDIEALPPQALDFAFFANLRYAGQGYELRVPLPALDTAPDPEAAIVEACRSFAETYHRTYGYDDGNNRIEGVDWHLTVSGRARPRAASVRRATAAMPAGGPGATSRPVWFPEYGAYRDTPVHHRSELDGGLIVRGPAIVQEAESTTVIPPGCRAHASERGHLIVHMPGAHHD